MKISKESSGDDYSQPFVRERDSRKVFERDAEGRASFENRERARDAFLQLLRDFKSAQSAVNDQSMAALVPNEDRARVYLPPIASPSQRGRQKGKGRGDETLRSRASGVVRDLLPSNQEWFARFFDATVVRVALSRDLNADYQKLRKLEARFEHTKTTVEGPHSVFGHDEQFFALFVAAADAALFRHHLLGTLADAIRADLRDLESNNKFDTLDRVAVRSRLVAFLVCLPYYATARRNTPAPIETRVAWPVDLDPETLFFVESSLVASTDVALPKNGDSGSLELAAGKIFCATHLCRALKWTTFKKIDAIDAARLAARSLAERREVSAHAVFARLEIERLFDDLRLDISLFSPTTVLCFGEDDSASTSPPTQTPRKMYALSPLALDNTPERQREQSVPRTQLDVPALTIRAEYAAQIKASFSTKATQASPAAPSSKRKKLRPFLLVAPVLDDDTPDLFAPLADCFFRRYPLLKQAAELALDAATAHATDLPGEEALAVAKDKLSTLIKFAPPDAPEKLVEVASNLALQRFERSVLPGLLHKMHLRTHESSLLPDDEEADSSYVDASTQHVGGGRDGADAKGRARVALTNITAIPARADIQREDSSPHQRRHPVPSQQIKRFLLPPETPPRALSESASRSSPPPPPVFNIEQNLANFGSDAQPAEVERTFNVLQPRVNVLQPRAREG